MCRKAQGKVKEFIQNHKRDSYLARTPKPLLIRDTSYTPSVPSWPGPLVTSSGSVVSQPGNILHLGPTRVSPERVRIFPLLLLSSCPDNAPCPEIWPPPTLLELVTLKQRLWDLVLPPKEAREATQKLCPWEVTSLWKEPLFSSPSSLLRTAPRHILLEDFPCSWTDTTANLSALCLQSPLWSNIKVSPGDASHPSLSAFLTFSSPCCSEVVLYKWSIILRLFSQGTQDFWFCLYLLFLITW